MASSKQVLPCSHSANNRLRCIRWRLHIQAYVNPRLREGLTKVGFQWREIRLHIQAGNHKFHTQSLLAIPHALSLPATQAVFRLCMNHALIDVFTFCWSKQFCVTGTAYTGPFLGKKVVCHSISLEVTPTRISRISEYKVILLASAHNVR